jgi:hypothetical protein
VAIKLDDRLQAVAAARRAQGRDARLFLRLERLQGRAGALAGHPEFLTVCWVPHRWPEHTLETRNVGGTTVFMESRIARYTDWNELIISAWQLGPFSHPTVDPEAIFAMEAWERTHPVPYRSATRISI